MRIRWNILLALLTIGIMFVPAGSAVAGPKPDQKGESVPAHDESTPTGEFGYGDGASDGEVGTQSHGGGHCTIYASDPWRSGNAIKGEGTQSCTSAVHLQRVCVTLQQYRGLGSWSNKTKNCSAFTEDDFRRQSVSWTCPSGTGNQEYRIVTDGEFIDADGATFKASVQSQNYLRVTCPS